MNVAVIGAGFMGWQIADRCANHGHSVALMDISEEALRNACSRIRGTVRPVTELSAAVSHADVVIEAVPERLELKRELFHDLDRLSNPAAILATNSSSLRISQIETEVAHRDRVLNMHFYGPVSERPMVELMRGSETSDSVLEQARAFARSIGMTPLIVRKESTGLIFNRVWRAIKKESLRVADQGVATHEDVDRAFMIFMNQKMGPFGLMDMIGLDVIRDIENVYYRESGDPSDAPPRYLLDRTEAGELGVKTGKGFYTYPDPAFERPDFL